jgi:mannose-1-phosphate guanylyltransferase/mannose-6-phosphate isomerase
MIEEFSSHSKECLSLVSRAVENATSDLGFLRLATIPWSQLDDVSIDYAVMEKSKNLVVVPYKSKWSDLGGWDSVWSEGDKDPYGNVVTQSAHSIDCANSLLRSENSNQHVVGIGLEDIIAVVMPDAVLVAHKDRAQDVKKSVALLKKKGIAEAETFPKDHRPWGWFESLVIGGRFQVKRIYVKPGAALSLQSHNHRSEHWIVVEGTAKVTVDKEIKLVTEGESIYVPLGSKHRMENPGKLPMILIEVQIGAYLGEDDIIRFDDVYSRQ